MITVVKKCGVMMMLQGKYTLLNQLEQLRCRYIQIDGATWTGKIPQ
jgi:hypothetical protein